MLFSRLWNKDDLIHHSLTQQSCMLSCFALVGGYDLAVVTNLDVCLCGHQESKSKSLDKRA